MEAKKKKKKKTLSLARVLIGEDKVSIYMLKLGFMWLF